MTNKEEIPQVNVKWKLLIPIIIGLIIGFYLMYYLLGGRF